MSELFREKITSKDISIETLRKKDTIINTNKKTVLINYAALIPTNMTNKEGSPLKMLSSDDISIEVSKRRMGMSYWHRNMDYDEIIICIKGNAKWETDDGEFNLNEGNLLYIPRGIAHILTTASSDYMAIEIKSKTSLNVEVKNIF